MQMQRDRDGIAVYHVVLAHEDFDLTALKLLQLLRKDDIPDELHGVSIEGNLGKEPPEETSDGPKPKPRF